MTGRKRADPFIFSANFLALRRICGFNPNRRAERGRPCLNSRLSVSLSFPFIKTFLALLHPFSSKNLFTSTVLFSLHSFLIFRLYKLASKMLNDHNSRDHEYNSKNALYIQAVFSDPEPSKMIDDKGDDHLAA